MIINQKLKTQSLNITSNFTSNFTSIFAIAFTFIYTFLFSQILFSHTLDKTAAIDKSDQIIEEGKMIFNLEVTSYSATEVFLSNYKGDKSKVGGYFSYYSKDKNQFINVYYNNDNNGKTPQIIFTTRYTLEEKKSEINTESVKKEQVEREMTDFEKNLYKIRTKTIELFAKDTAIKHYDNTALNVIPMYYNGQYKSYIITIPKIEGIVVMGNDYLIDFDNNLNISKRTKLHSDILPVDIGNDKNRGITYHTHIKSTGDLLTPTDVAILLLSAKGAGWLKHFVMASDWVTMWDVTTEKFTIKSRVEFDRENGQ